MSFIRIILKTAVGSRFLAQHLDSSGYTKNRLITNKVTTRFFDQLNAATKIETLRIPPSNHLEKLKGNLRNYWSIRINKQWRVIFKWEKSEAIEVDIIDYH